MKGPDDLAPVVPLAIRLEGARRMGQWRCPRCDGLNASSLALLGETAAICRGCFQAITIAEPPISSPLPTKIWQTTLPGGTKIVIRPEERGGYSYEAEAEQRVFTASDSAWSRHEAYEAAVRAVRSRTKPRG